MAKELPYFQFEPAEYLTKDISFCSLSAQGLFINICAYYWQRQCVLSLEQFKRRLNHEKELQELIKEGVIDIVENYIKIKFLDNQYLNATKKSKTNSINGSKGGRPKKENQTETEIKPNENQIESETKGIREDKIIKDEIKEDNKIENEDFLIDENLQSLNTEKKERKKVPPKKEINLPNGFSEIWDLWLEYRKAKKITNYAGDKFEQMAIDKLAKLSNNNPIIAKQIITESITNSWTGFFELKNKPNGTEVTYNRNR